MGQNKLFPFSTVVFTSWDHHLTDVKAARNLRNSIRNQLAEMVFDAELADAYITKSKRIISILLKVRFAWTLSVRGLRTRSPVCIAAMLRGSAPASM